MPHLINRQLLMVFLLAGLFACNTNTTKSPTLSTSESVSEPDLQPADYHIVDCLLPGQFRNLGHSIYVTPGQPLLTTAANCRLQKGTYVEHYSANYKTALNVWLPAAEAGDLNAQTNVGEIFERGLGGNPNYLAAAIWYQKAAAQGNTRAQFNLGTLYEQGLGVPEDQLIAINWYRKAWGIPEDALMYRSAVADAENELRVDFQKKIDETNQQINLLKNQITHLQTRLQDANNNEKNQNNDAKSEILSLGNWIKNLEAEQLLAKKNLDNLPEMRDPNAIRKVKSPSETGAINTQTIKWGKYYALIIANQDYDTMSDLSTPLADAQRAQKILQEFYGFQVTTLVNADHTAIMSAINHLNDHLSENDNVLIFYTGYGVRISAGELESGYWLPRNAKIPPDDSAWVSNEFVTRHLARLKAKHILVVADACYTTSLSSLPGYLLMSEKIDYREGYIRDKLSKRSRLLLSSGSDQPIPDTQVQEHSVFSRAFLDALEQSNNIISGTELFFKIKNQLSTTPQAADFNQIPEFKPIKGAGHEVGDFFFIKQSP